MPRFAAGAPYLWPVPINGYARVSTDGQTLDAQIAQLKAAGAERSFARRSAELVLTAPNWPASCAR